MCFWFELMVGWGSWNKRIPNFVLLESICLIRKDVEFALCERLWHFGPHGQRSGSLACWLTEKRSWVKVKQGVEWKDRPWRLLMGAQVENLEQTRIAQRCLGQRTGRLEAKRCTCSLPSHHACSEEAGGRIHPDCVFQGTLCSIIAMILFWRGKWAQLVHSQHFFLSHCYLPKKLNCSDNPSGKVKTIYKNKT